MTIQAVLKKMIPNLAYREGYSTWASYECAVFTKLALAYVINTSVLPLLVGVLPLGITQAWHEEHGQKTAVSAFQREDAQDAEFAKSAFAHAGTRTEAS